MELSAFDIVKKTVVTSKSIDLFKRFGRITFEVHCSANKVMIKQAVEKIWDVKVDKVRIISLTGKNKMFARRAFKTSDRKKAIVALKKGYKIDIPGMFESMGASGSESPVASSTPADKE